ncbi:MAG: class I SAM-dependent DNA methyltransferase [Bacillus sp. (in: firmicutes)]
MGREFLPIFADWASRYDKTVSGGDVEYAEVFRNYESILEEVAHLSSGHVLEFGAGTGNLTERLLLKGRRVTAIEPSVQMMEIAMKKLSSNHLDMLEGDFLEFPTAHEVDTIVSTYAFHHLTDQEKEKAIQAYGNLLPIGGKIVFADTMFESEETFLKTVEDAEKLGYHTLAEDLRTEYYPLMEDMEAMFTKNGFDVQFKRCNHFAWIVEAIKTIKGAKT